MRTVKEWKTEVAMNANAASIRAMLVVCDMRERKAIGNLVADEKLHYYAIKAQGHYYAALQAKA